MNRPLGLGSDSITLTPGVDMRSDAGSFRLLFIVGADGEEDAARIRKDIERMRASGELAQIIARMQLD